MEKFWKPLSYNFDSNKLKYISTIEAHKFPFVGVQFHPEKNIFEWATNTVGNIPHNRSTMPIFLIMLYRVFFNESRKVIGYKVLKISLFHVCFGLRTEVTLGHLISDHFKMNF